MTLRQDLRREWREDCRRLQAQWGANGPTWPQWLAYKDEIAAEEAEAAHGEA